MKPTLTRAADEAAARPAALWARAEAWRRAGRPGVGTSATRVLAIYDALGHPPTVAEVKAIEPLQTFACDGCGAEGVDRLVFGEDIDYESVATRLCRACVEEGLALFASVPSAISGADVTTQPPAEKS